MREARRGQQGRSQQTDSSTLLAAVFALDGERAGLAVEQSLRERGVIDTWDSLLQPAFGALSTLQIEGADCLDVEHLLSRVTTRALQRIPTRSTWSGSADATVLACCDGEAHTLALEALAAALGQSGCAAVMLGASVPAAAISTALARLTAAWAVVLWSQRPSTTDVTGYGRSRRRPRKVAGPGWDEFGSVDVSADWPRSALQSNGLRNSAAFDASISHPS